MELTPSRWTVQVYPYDYSDRDYFWWELLDRGEDAPKQGNCGSAYTPTLAVDAARARAKEIEKRERHLATPLLRKVLM